ncbi:hypothetical protein ACVRZD_01600 [Streptococcus hongkongensis]|nr:hypothetical protein NC01_09085 [Streptococcus uberis]
MNIKRQTTFFKIGTTITVYIGNLYTAKLKNSQEMTCHFEGKQELKVKSSLQKKILITDSDHIVISDNPLPLLLFWSGILTVVISHLCLSYDSPVLYYLSILSLLLIVFSYLMPQVKLTIKNQ